MAVANMQVGFSNQDESHIMGVGREACECLTRREGDEI